tara:strand:- start:221 stop:415 length:195 start_codon:yes stop_codon:yes gene_type:complete
MELLVLFQTLDIFLVEAEELMLAVHHLQAEVKLGKVEIVMITVPAVVVVINLVVELLEMAVLEL